MFILVISEEQLLAHLLLKSLKDFNPQATEFEAILKKFTWRDLMVYTVNLIYSDRVGTFLRLNNVNYCVVG